MTSHSMAFVVTSINAVSPSLLAIGRKSAEGALHAVMVGDRKGPETCTVEGIDFYSLRDQKELGFRSAVEGPIDSYTRKLTGYLIAISRGAEFIRETDDDNNPYETFFEDVPDFLEVRTVTSENRWINIYSVFTDRHIWPRGFPLNQIKNPDSINFLMSLKTMRMRTTHIIQQSLADGDPDVDAVYRLTAANMDEVIFRRQHPVKVSPSAWTPFNSQATTWPRRLFPLMYLPATCSFRMTDIWRSFVTQRALREIDSYLVYTNANVYQNRNMHNLMTDFAEEIEGYLTYDMLIDLLESIDLEKGDEKIASNLRKIYGELVRAEFLTGIELGLLEAWLSDLKYLGFNT